MKDKVQKIREEVERLKEETSIGLSEHENGVEQGRMEILNAISNLFDSMQEEPQVKESEELQHVDETCKENGNSLTQEPVSEDLISVAKQYIDSHVFGNEEDKFTLSVLVDMFCSGAKWQAEQFEKNRLAACDRQAEEEAEIERDFVMGIIENEHRQPTYDDAIKYGMRLQKEQMMANTADVMIGLPYENKDGGYTQLIDVSRPLPVGDNKIAIIFKED